MTVPRASQAAINNSRNKRRLSMSFSSTLYSVLPDPMVQRRSPSSTHRCRTAGESDYISCLGCFPFFSPLKSTPSIQAALSLVTSSDFAFPLGQKSLHPSSRVTFGLFGLWQLLQLNSQRGQRYFSLMVGLHRGSGSHIVCERVPSYCSTT